MKKGFNASANKLSTQATFTRLNSADSVPTSNLVCIKKVAIKVPVATDCKDVCLQNTSKSHSYLYSSVFCKQKQFLVGRYWDLKITFYCWNNLLQLQLSY